MHNSSILEKFWEDILELVNNIILDQNIEMNLEYFVSVLGHRQDTKILIRLN